MPPAFLLCVVLLLVGWVMALLLHGVPSKELARVVEAQEAGKEVPFHRFFSTEIWKALIANTVLAALLVCAAPWLGRSLQRPAVSRSAKSSESGNLLLLIGVGIGLAVVAGFLNAPRLDHSLWGDEEYMAKRYIVGLPEIDKETGVRVLEELPWKDTVFRTRRGNNHFLSSVLARASHEFGFSGEAANGLHFSERTLRWPVFLAGLLAVGTLMLCARSYLSFAGALAAGAFLVLHPLFTRYSVELRGYSFVLLLLPLTCWLLRRAIEKGQWRWWLLLAGSEFLLFWAHSSMLFFLAPLHLVALWWIFRRKGSIGETGTILSRWTVSGVLAAMAAILFHAPYQALMRQFLAEGGAKAELQANWGSDLFGYFISGNAWNRWEQNNPLCSPLAESVKESPFLTVLALVLCSLAALIGLFHWFRKSPWTAGLAVALILHPVLFALPAILRGNVLYYWHLAVPALPAFLLFQAGAVDWASQIRGRNRIAAPIVIGVVLLGSMLWLMSPRNEVLRNHSVEPLLEAMEIAEASFGENSPATLGLVMYTELYATRFERVKTADEFHAALERAEKEGRGIVIQTSSVPLIRALFPEVAQVLEDKSRFERVRPALWGAAPSTTRHVFRSVAGRSPTP